MSEWAAGGQRVKRWREVGPAGFHCLISSQVTLGRQGAWDNDALRGPGAVRVRGTHGDRLFISFPVTFL